MSVNLPEEYLVKMKELLQDEYDAFLASFDEQRTYGLRVNTNKISVEEFLKISPFELEPIPWISDAFYYKEEDHPGKHPYYYAGLYYLQDPSAMTPAELLPVEEHDRVMDTCAAPGGKSTKLANKLKGTGMLFSNDISVSRCNALLKNLERNGSDNIFVCSEDTSKLERYFPGYFDKILVDAPCSGEGMFRKEPDLIKSWMERGPEYYAPIQKQILLSAVNMLKDGGYVLYSTCTFAKCEDEDVIEYVMDQCPGLEVVPIENRYEGFAYGLTERTHDCVRCYPHKLKGEGHFCALLRKGEGSCSNTPVSVKNRMPAAIEPFFRQFPVDFTKGTVQEMNGRVYRVPEIPNTKGLRILRSGLYLGEVKNKRFEPGQALAMAMKASEIRRRIELPVDDIRVMKYLKGETIRVDESDLDGYVLVCVGQYPLGFGVLKNHQLKNKLAKGWTMH